MTTILKEKTELSFYTQYSQFYICDKTADMDKTDEFWSDEAFAMRLADHSGVLGIGTECYGPVKGEINFLGQSPQTVEFSDFDHVVEGDLEISSGILQIQDCPNGAVEFEKELPLGNYRVRIYSINLGSVDGDEGDDYYRIEVWRGQPLGKRLLKEYKNH